ncbi:unnamed protein product [Closterium sp. NIES-54]
MPPKPRTTKTSTMVPLEDPKVQPLEQNAGVEAGSATPASVLAGEGQDVPAPALAPAEPVPAPIMPAATAPVVQFPEEGDDEDEDEDDGYLSDDPDEGIDVQAKGVLVSKTRVTLTLLIPFELAKEMLAVKPSVKALLVFLRKKLSNNALDGVAFQDLLPTYPSNIHFSRLQVTPPSADDAEVVRQHRVEHVVGTTNHHFGWQHPVNRSFLKAKSDLPEGEEVLLKGVPTEITPLIVHESLVVAKLQKRGRSAFLQGAGFHRMVDPVLGLDTDKTRGLVLLHLGDKYRWRHLVEVPLSDATFLVHFPSLSFCYCEGQHMDKLHNEYVCEHRRLPPEDVDELCAPWEEAEVTCAPAEMARGKTPGRDGLPKELWELKWDLLGGQVLQSVKEFERTGSLPTEFSTTVTVTAYKVVAKILANMIKHKLEKVVSEGQFGFLPGISLVGAVAIAADVIDVANSGQKDWLMLLVDFKKAFDSVGWEYLFDVLRKMGFPKVYVKWVEGLHHEVATRICNNGWLGEEALVQTGVRQGFPLVLYLFLCAVEPFCQEAQRRWLGIDVKGAGKLTYLGYADDTTLHLKVRSQLDDAEMLLKDFERLSGLAVNWDKSVVLPLGRQRDLPPPIAGSFKWASRDDPERLLGVWITPGGDARPSWRKALSRIEAELKKWEAKYITSMARVTVVNSYVMPIAVFQAQVYPPLDVAWEELRRLCHAFFSGDAEALHLLALLLTEEVPQRRVLAEKVVNLPLGYASLLAHESLLKAWGTGSERWKAIAAAVMASPVARNLPTENRWDTEKE